MLKAIGLDHRGSCLAATDHSGASDVMQGQALSSKAGVSMGSISRAEFPPVLLMCKFGSPFPSSCNQEHSLHYFVSIQPNSSSAKVPANGNVGEDLRQLRAPPQGSQGRRTSKKAH